MDDLIVMGENIPTNGNNYIPTGGEQKLLQAMLNPENTGSTIVALCTAAGTSRDTYYSAMKKPEFVKLYQDTAISMIKHEVYPLIKAGIREAKRGNYQYWKTLLQMSGMIETDETAGNNVILIKFGD
jgi:hypothetical protein